MKIEHLIWGYLHEVHIQLAFDEDDRKKYPNELWNNPIAIIINSKQRGSVNGVFLYEGEEPTEYMWTYDTQNMDNLDRETLIDYYKELVQKGNLKEQWEDWNLFKPMEVGPDSEEMLIQGFLSTGQTTHSERAGMMGIVIKYCEENFIPYHVEAIPGIGYCVKKTEIDNEIVQKELERLRSLKRK